MELRTQVRRLLDSSQPEAIRTGTRRKVAEKEEKKKREIKAPRLGSKGEREAKSN